MEQWEVYDLKKFEIQFNVTLTVESDAHSSIYDLFEDWRTMMCEKTENGSFQEFGVCKISIGRIIQEKEVICKLQN